jgi:hypothetical protein
MGDAIFLGAFDAELCAKACSQKSVDAMANPPSDGSPVQTCQFFNTYILYINKTSNVQGQYCAMYSESWSSRFATNVGQHNNQTGDNFLLEYSFTYSNASDPGSANPSLAVSQAKRDILDPSNSATAVPYCSSMLGYNSELLATVSATATAIEVSTVTTIDATTTLPLSSATSVTAIVFASLTTTTTMATVTTTMPAAGHVERQLSAIDRPSAFSRYPASILSSACQLAIMPTGQKASFATTMTVATSTSTSVTTVDLTRQSHPLIWPR